MNKTIFFITSLFAVSVSFAQQAKLNQLDAQGKRHGQWKGMYEGTTHPRYEGTFDHGKETGTFKFYTNTDRPLLKATRVFAKDGSCITTFFDEKGSKVSEGKEVNHKQEGEWKYYHSGGKAIMALEFYKDGKLSGKRKVFYPDGAVAEESNYVNGIKEGSYKKFNEKGIVLEEATYVNGTYDGKVTFRDDAGNVASEGMYKDNLKTGIWKFYENGKLVKQQDMDGKKVAVPQQEKTSGTN